MIIFKLHSLPPQICRMAPEPGLAASLSCDHFTPHCVGNAAENGTQMLPQPLPAGWSPLLPWTMGCHEPEHPATNTCTRIIPHCPCQVMPMEKKKSLKTQVGFEGTGLCLGPQLNPHIQLTTCTQHLAGSSPCNLGKYSASCFRAELQNNQLFVSGSAVLVVPIIQAA